MKVEIGNDERQIGAHYSEEPQKESVLDEKLCDFSTYIGLDHPGRGVRSASNMERAIKIAS